jgi:hypothetical protein
MSFLDVSTLTILGERRTNKKNYTVWNSSIPLLLQTPSHFKYLSWYMNALSCFSSSKYEIASHIIQKQYNCFIYLNIIKRVVRPILTYVAEKGHVYWEHLAIRLNQFCCYHTGQLDFCNYWQMAIRRDNVISISLHQVC